MLPDTPVAMIQHFLDVAARLPENVAVDEAGRTTSYGELARRARAVATHLASLDIGANDVVAIDLARSTDAIVALLGTHLAGAAYLPLGPHLPDARVQTILAESRACALLSTSRLRRPCDLERPVLELDALPCVVEPTEPATPAAGDLAYVIYTSGSTGTPKGVAIDQGSLSHLCRWFGEYFATTPRDRFSHLATLNFDASVWEIWPALTRGACLCIVDEQVKRSPSALLQWLVDQAVSVAWLPTVLATEVCRMPAKKLSQLRALRVLTAAGEKLSAFAPAGLDCAFYNCYGPSEATVCTTVARVPAEYTGTDGAPAIGRPIAGKNVLLLDPDGQPVADGEVGEIFIYGSGLARGYLHRPDLTAERFVEREWAGERVRMFRTGDLACRDAHGELHFRGRCDNQVKICGYRVELEEVERALCREPGVVSSIAVLDTSTCPPALVAHVVPAAGAVLSAVELRRQLQHGLLPDYMVPAAVFFYDAFPTTGHDKVDRGALRRLVNGKPLDASSGDVIALVRAVLGDEVELDAGFLAAGGNSVAAMGLLAELKRRHDVHLSISELFGLPRLADLEQKVSRAQGARSAWIVRRRDRTQRLPASPSQELVWFLDKLEPNNPAYIAKAMVFLRGRLDVSALHASLQDVIDRHEIYRTRFVEDDEGVVQTVEERALVALPVREEEIAEADLNRRCTELMTSLLGAPFDLERLPLARFALVRVTSDLHVLLHAEHHIVHDGWSYNELLRDLFTCYRDRSGGRLPQARETYHFGDFSQSQRAWLATPDAARQRDYWRAKLANAPAVLELPTDRARGEGTFRGATLRSTLSREVWQRCEALARQYDVTPFALVLAVFSVVLGRHAGSRDVCIGSGFANRNWGNAERILGMVINTVVLRNSFASDQNFDEFLLAVGRTVTEALANQELPFAEVVKMLNPPRQRGVNPLFQVFMGFHDAPLAKFDVDGLDVRVLEALGNGASKFDLSLVVIPRTGQVEAGDPVNLIWEYNTTLFSGAFAERLHRSLLCALDAVLAQPTQPVCDIPLVAPIDRAALVRLLCPPPQALPAWVSLDRQVEGHAAADPERTALQCIDERLSYGQLAQRVTHLAQALARAGIGPGDRVAVGVPRRCNLVALLLAIHKLGACYVPVDPRYPAERLRYILDDAAARLLVTEAAVADAFAGVATPMLHLDNLPAPAQGELDAIALPAGAVTGESTAYVLYTSGSTGRPKGVAVSQAAFANFIHGIVQRTGLGRDDRLLAVTSLSFDIAGLELLVPLTLGAQVTIADEESVFDGLALQDKITRHGITVMQATPATWRLLVGAGWRAGTPFTALCGGEAMPPSLAGALLAAGATLYNLYGPTETTVWSTAHRVSAPGAASVPLGRPIANTQLFVLDESMRLLPQGAVGQLYIGGLGLAQGYIGKPELTRQRFVPNPYRDLCRWSSERLYATGDLVRVDANGDLLYLARCDEQIKLRGHRIELGEIEAALESHPQIANAAAHVVTGADGEPVLVGHVVPTVAGTSLNPADLIAHASERLPAYMVPRVLSTLERLPLTPNGKLDRKALPGIVPAIVSQAPIAPRNQIEGTVLEEFIRVLRRPELGVNEDFFAMGGHSLQLSDLLAGINVRTGAALKIRDVFVAGTVEALAARVARQRQLDALVDESAWDAHEGEEFVL